MSTAIAGQWDSVTWRGLIGLLLSLGGMGIAQAGPGELVEAEHRFASSAWTHGVRSAFLEFLAEDGVLFRPRPVSGVAFFRGQEEEGGLLEWAPAYAQMADSGDLGFTTGPWRYRASRTNATVQATGQYVTVWRRMEEGWRVAFDAGVGGPAMSFSSRAETEGPRTADASLGDWERDQRLRELKEAEGVWSRRSAREGEAAALDEQGHKRVWVLRSGAPPVRGRTEGVRLLASNSQRTRDRADGVFVSRAGDLGWAWGESEQLGSGTVGPQAVRSWMRVWSRSGWSRTWRVVLDLAVVYPEEVGVPPQ